MGGRIIVFRYRITDFILAITIFLTLLSVLWIISIESGIIETDKDYRKYSLGNEYLVSVSGDIYSNVKDYMAESFEVVEQSNLTIQLNDSASACLATVFVDGDLSKWYPLKEGRYPSEDEIKNGELIVLLGSKRMDQTFSLNGVDYIKIENEVYKVIGNIGTSGSESFEYDIVLFDRCVGNNINMIIDNMAKNTNVDYHIGDDTVDISEAYREICDFIESINVDIYVKISDNYKENYAKDGRDNEFVFLLISLLCISELILFSEVWVKKRYEELFIRRLYGYSYLKLLLYLSSQVGMIILFDVPVLLVTCIVLKTIGVINIRFAAAFFAMYFGTGFLLWVLIILKATFTIKSQGFSLAVYKKKI
jgi:hypothetical protein